jgi:CheY-like chemotaxis protein
MAGGKPGKRSRKRPQKTRARPALTQRAVEAALAGIAHDLRTPLTGMVALAELLSSSDLHEREREWANALRSGADHLAALTNLIVDAVRADTAGLVLRDEPFSPRALVGAVGTALAARAGNKSIKAELTVAPDLPELVSGDVVRLRAALENLADNAMKFTDTGSVAFTAGARPLANDRVSLVFTVADTGIGMTSAELKRLFKPFAQVSVKVSRRFGGAGLGLVFVKRVAEAMGGEFTVTSKRGRGTQFRLSVPVKRVPNRRASERTDGITIAARPLSILCAEDNPYGRVVMNTILRELGHLADFVETGAAAVAAAERGTYDVILMDVALPGMDGIEATRRIRALPGKRGQVPVFGTSGRDDGRHEAAARAAGMNGYFIKPVSPSKLARALAAIP